MDYQSSDNRKKLAPSRDATPQEANLIGLVELMHASVASRSWGSTPVGVLG